MARKNSKTKTNDTDAPTKRPRPQPRREEREPVAVYVKVAKYAAKRRGELTSLDIKRDVFPDEPLPSLGWVHVLILLFGELGWLDIIEEGRRGTPSTVRWTGPKMRDIQGEVERLRDDFEEADIVFRIPYTTYGPQRRYLLALGGAWREGKDLTKVRVRKTKDELAKEEAKANGALARVNGTQQVAAAQPASDELSPEARRVLHVAENGLGGIGSFLVEDGDTRTLPKGVTLMQDPSGIMAMVRIEDLNDFRTVRQRRS